MLGHVAVRGRECLALRSFLLPIFSQEGGRGGRGSLMFSTAPWSVLRVAARIPRWPIGLAVLVASDGGGLVSAPGWCVFVPRRSRRLTVACLGGCSSLRNLVRAWRRVPCRAPRSLCVRRLVLSLKGLCANLFGGGGSAGPCHMHRRDPCEDSGGGPQGDASAISGGLCPL